ncbi:MAG: DUF4041 domain-containing protein [Nannocystales bacterium]
MDPAILIAIGVCLALLLGLAIALLLARRSATLATARAEESERQAAALRPYAVVPDAQAEANRILQHAQASAQQMVSEADVAARAAVTTATTEAQAITSQAHELSAAKQAESASLIEHARQEAERIAGDALRARDKSEDYRQAARAMKNIVDGYGEEVWVPGTSLLDDLADELDYQEAGRRLKEARQRTRDILKASGASECDYKERVRRETAMRFVADAFNGKVDSILSKVKHDNYGKLEASINDAFAIVNLNGQAFKNARITQDYLAARTDELQWAVRAMELQKREREEQRRIKDELREEERARKEFEKAIKAADKEERAVQRAMKAAQKHLAEATEAHKAKYETLIQELQGKLAEAEAKGQRALSMAQQTRRGHVYVISNVGSFGDGVYKIGLTRRLEPRDRVKELGDASVPFEFDIHAMIQAEDAPALESKLHRRFVGAQVNKVNSRKEFFRVSVSDIRDVVNEMGIECSWTMAAAAREYRESLALAKKGTTAEPGLRPKQNVDGLPLSAPPPA